MGKYNYYLGEAPEWRILSHCHSTTRAPWTNYHVANISLSKLSDKGSSCTNTITLHVYNECYQYVVMHECVVQSIILCTT